MKERQGGGGRKEARRGGEKEGGERKGEEEKGGEEIKGTKNIDISFLS